MKGRIIIVVLLLILLVSFGQSFALVFSEGGIPERVKKRGLRVSCFVLCKGGEPRSLEKRLDGWIRTYLQGKLEDLKFVDEKKVTYEKLKTLPHLTISFKGEGMYEVKTAYHISVEVRLLGHDVIVEGIHGSYQFWWSHNSRLGVGCDLIEFRELVRPILDEFIYQYLTGTPANPK